MLVSVKVDFRRKRIAIDEESLHGDKRVNSRRINGNFECVFVKQQKCKVCETNSDRAENSYKRSCLAVYMY
jgi:hypothetical protein